MTAQKRMQTKLEKCGIPYKRIDVYGRQIMITTWSIDAAERWAACLRRFAKVRPIVESLDDNKVNRGTVLNPTCHKVWLIAATV